MFVCTICMYFYQATWAMYIVLWFRFLFAKALNCCARGSEVSDPAPAPSHEFCLVRGSVSASSCWGLPINRWKWICVRNMRCHLHAPQQQWQQKQQQQQEAATMRATDKPRPETIRQLFAQRIKTKTKSIASVCLRSAALPLSLSLSLSLCCPALSAPLSHTRALFLCSRWPCVPCL